MKTVGYSFKQAKQSKKTELLKSLASQSVGKKISKGEEINLEKGVIFMMLKKIYLWVWLNW